MGPMYDWVCTDTLDGFGQVFKEHSQNNPLTDFNEEGRLLVLPSNPEVYIEFNISEYIKINEQMNSENTSYFCNLELKWLEQSADNAYEI